MSRTRFLAIALLMAIAALVSGCGSDTRDRIEGALPSRTTTIPGDTVAPDQTTAPGDPGTQPPATEPPATVLHTVATQALAQLHPPAPA